MIIDAVSWDRGPTDARGAFGIWDLGPMLDSRLSATLRAPKTTAGFVMQTIGETMEHGGLSLTIAADHEIEIIDDVGCIACVLDGHVCLTTQGIQGDTIAHGGQNVAFKRGAKSLLSAFRDAVVFIPAPRGALGIGFALRRITGGSMLTIAASHAESLVQLARWLPFAGPTRTTSHNSAAGRGGYDIAPAI